MAQRALRKVQRETQATIESLVDALEVRDVYTHNHSVRVTKYVEALLAELPHVPSATRQVIVDAARVHDVGKMGVRDTALLKPGKLSDEEYEEIKRHPSIGADLIGNLEMYRRGVTIVRHHHERWDGRGYPDGLIGDQIPLGARIIAVADSFDAMTSDRPYRRAMTVAVALAEIKRNSGIQFDPQIVEAFERAMSAPHPVTERESAEVTVSAAPAA
jgi:HD-GYP domain-containing protein (c-di-GMP phosphodiesterase class II)